MQYIISSIKIYLYFGFKKCKKLRSLVWGQGEVIYQTLNIWFPFACGRRLHDSSLLIMGKVQFDRELLTLYAPEGGVVESNTPPPTKQT